MIIIKLLKLGNFTTSSYPFFYFFRKINKYVIKYLKLSELSMFISYSGLCPECSDFHQRSKFFFLVLSGAD